MRNDLIAILKNNPTEHECLCSVKEDGDYLQFIKNPSIEVCLAAIETNATAISWIQNPTMEMYFHAVKKYPYSIKYFKVPLFEHHLEAVKIQGLALRKVPKKFRTKEICEIAVKNNGKALKHVDNKTPEICLLAMESPFAPDYWEIELVQANSLKDAKDQLTQIVDLKKRKKSILDSVRKASI